MILPGPADRAVEGASRARLDGARIEADGASVRVEADGAGHVVFSRTWFPAWKARVDGRDAPVLVANARDLAVAVPAGVHDVEFSWDRRPFVTGVGLQAAALVLAAAAAIGLAVRPRRASARPGAV